MSVGHSPVSEAVALLSAGDAPSPLHQQISLLHSQISWVQSQTQEKKKKCAGSCSEVGCKDLSKKNVPEHHMEGWMASAPLFSSTHAALVL